MGSDSDEHDSKFLFGSYSLVADFHWNDCSFIDPFNCSCKILKNDGRICWWVASCLNRTFMRPWKSIFILFLHQMWLTLCWEVLVRLEPFASWSCCPYCFSVVWQFYFWELSWDKNGSWANNTQFHFLMIKFWFSLTG